jgi:hypothetical protein
MRTHRSRLIRLIITLAIFLSAWNLAQAQGVKVNTVTPAQAEQTQTLDIVIDGNGFDNGSTITFYETGEALPSGKIVINSKSTASSKQMLANITVLGDANTVYYDVEVQNTRGRRGKGNTLFRVLETGSGGGNSNPYDGEDIPLDCEIVNSNTNGSGGSVTNHVRNDGLGLYRDGEDKVGCGTGGTVQPNLSGIFFNSFNKGPAKRAVRKIDIAFGPCVGSGCSYVPAELFGPTGATDDLEDVTIGTHPFPEQGHLQLMDPGEHKMASRIAPKAFAHRFSIQFMERAMPGDFHQGIWCDLSYHPTLKPEDAGSEDMTVYLWPDNDGDDLPDGYTITTGTIDDSVNQSPPDVIADTRIGTICSSTGPLACAGPSDGDLCNLLGHVEVGFTIHARNQ